ncbi:MAG: hypothetical protein JXR94_09140 [Candidatus Hydrogenedentes bacterium]|nr:hypothetical protein [Candidatus Hydrogenedentota bacterium]
MSDRDKAKTRVHVITYTHWDREFRWEFERTRMRLVDCIDHLLEILEQNPEYKHFMMDGQFTLIEDYLEIRPEKRDLIARLAQEGRLEIGPWFTLPDCAPINGESVVRNLAYGVRRSNELGACLKCGYNVFSFGQIAQLPQIYADFGIDTIIFYKYMNPARTKYHEFFWEAPDGSRALASRLGPEARWNFFFAGHIPIVYARDPWHKAWQYRWGDLGKVFHTADPEGYGWFYDILDPDTSFHPEKVEEGMKRALDTVQGTAAPEVVLFFDGTDFTEPHPLTPDYLRAIQERFGDTHEVIHSTLTDYLAELRAALDGRTDLDVVSGPMRDGPVGAVHSDVFTTHPEVPTENSYAENALLRWAEPLAVAAWAHGIDGYPATYLDKAWKLLFQSHSHDSMHGLGPHTLAEGEMARLRQARIIAQGLERRGLENITKEIDTTSCEDSEYFVVVHNPSGFERSEVVEAYLDVPADVILEHLIVEDLEGRPVAVQEVDRCETRAGIYHPRSRNMPFYCTKVHCYFEAERVPALGYKTFKLKWAHKNEYPYPHEDFVVPRLMAENLLVGLNEAENEHLRVKVNGDGTLDVTDKRSGRVYRGLNYLQDQGEIGNMWISNPPANGSIITNTGEPAEVAVRVQGPLAVVFDIHSNWALPAEFDWTRNARAETRKEVPVHVQVVLRKGARWLEVITSFENTVKDHYLKVCFPTDLGAEKTWGEGSFSVTEYNATPSVCGELRGPELARHPVTMWFDLAEGKDGFAVLVDAAKDYEILDHDARRTLAMGLLRASRVRIPCDNRLWMEYPGDESAQSLGAHRFRYALMPHAGLWPEARVYDESLAFNAPMRACQFGRQAGMFPPEKSFLGLEGPGLVLSAVKKADNRDSILVRFYNPTNTDSEAVLHVGLPVSAAYRAGLDEERRESLPLEDGKVTLPVPHGKIVTVELEP